MAFIENPFNKPEVNHLDGHPLNNFIDNLEWATSSENIQHAYNTGLKLSGENCTWSKFTNEQVKYIRENPDGLNTVQLGEKFSVSPQTIGDVQLGKKYKNVGGIIRTAQYHTPRLSDEIRQKIRAEYVHGKRGFGAPALAKKYGVSYKTIWTIIHEEENND